MFSSLQVIAGPASEPVSVDLARRHLRVDHTDEDDLIAAYITGARTWAEGYLGRAMVSQQLRYTISQSAPPGGYPMLSMPLSLLVLPMWFQWPLAQQGSLRLPLQPVVSVDDIRYGQWGQADTVLVPDTDYDVDLRAGQLQIHPGSQILPNDHLSVTFTAGYSGNAVLPGTFVPAILILTAFLYENRGDVAAEMPKAAEMLLTPHRLVAFG